MPRIKMLFVFLFSVFSFIATAQEKKYDVSAPIDIKQTGCNKVLYMKNGNTLLFHFEPEKPITVKVFDSTHKEIANKEHTCRILDIYVLKDVILKGLYEVNGEAVLFMEQEHLSKNGLVRLRFSGSDGSLLEEKLLAESQGVSKKTSYYVMKNRDEDGYAILYSTDIPQFETCDIHVAYYNKDNESVKDIPLELDRKKYDYLDVVSAESRPNGICVSLSLSKLVSNGSRANIAGTYGSTDIYDHHLYTFYIAKDSNKAISTMVDVTTDLFPYYSIYTYNSFAKTLNLLLLSYQEGQYRSGLQILPTAYTANIFFKLDETNLDMGHNRIRNKMAIDYLKQKTDTNHIYDGLPVKLFTNKYGLSTLISESYTRYPENLAKDHRNTYLGNIAITQFDDDGNEIWGTVLPDAQYHTSYTNYYPAIQLSKRWQQDEILKDLPEQAYNKQFISFNAYTVGRNIDIIYNDNDKNFNNSIAHPGDTVYDFSLTNACYYKLDNKKEITKHYLFGTPVQGEFMASFLEGADFDEQRGVYATLVQCRKDNKITLCMAWCHLD